jgi:hypothetical protein
MIFQGGDNLGNRKSLILKEKISDKVLEGLYYFYYINYYYFVYVFMFYRKIKYEGINRIDFSFSFIYFE